MKYTRSFFISLTLASLWVMNATAVTEEHLNKTFKVQPGWNLVVDVDFGSVQIDGQGSNEVEVDVFRKVSRTSKSAEQEFLKSRPVEMTIDDGTVTIRSKAARARGWTSMGWNRTEAKYTIRVPAEFNCKVGTAGGGIKAREVKGTMSASTSGGGLRFEKLDGELTGSTAGGGIDVNGCKGKISINTSGGGIRVAGGSGTLTGSTAGGGITVLDFDGPAKVKTSGGGLELRNVTGGVDASTAGGSVSAILPSAGREPARLSTSGGGISVEVPGNAAFDLDAETYGGHVQSDVPVTVVGKLERSRLKGKVNGGGQALTLRTSAGSIHVKKGA